jgi:hypothetical protein
MKGFIINFIAEKTRYLQCWTMTITTIIKTPGGLLRLNLTKFQSVVLHSENNKKNFNFPEQL